MQQIYNGLHAMECSLYFSTRGRKKWCREATELIRILSVNGFCGDIFLETQRQRFTETSDVYVKLLEKSIAVRV